MKPGFSVLMSNYNKAKYIGDAIQSVINQTSKDWELVILDDCSTDGSISEIEKRAGSDQRIKVFKNEKRSGTAYCQKRMTELAKADIVGVLDSDDVLDKNALSEVLKIFNKYENIGFVYSRLMRCDENMKIIGPGSNSRIPKNETILRFDRVGAFRSFRKADYNKTSGYDPCMQFAEDADIVIKLEEVTEFYFIDKFLYYYRILPDSQFHTLRSRMINNINHKRSKYNAYLRRRNSNILNLTEKEISNEMYFAVSICLLLPDWKGAIYFLSKAITLCPINFLGFIKFFPRYIKFLIFGYPM